TYGQSKYVEKKEDKGIPTTIFKNVWLYAVLGLLFGVVMMQGPGAVTVRMAMASWLEASVFRSAFSWVDKSTAIDIGAKVATAFFGGVRLHHFYVDGKIWKVS